MIVMLAVALLLITGVPFFDAIEDKTSEERAKMYMTETDHTLSTVATTDDVRSIPVPPDADASIVDDGEMTVSWYNESTDKPFENGCVAPVNTSGELNALKYDLEDGTKIVHQAGGIWKYTDSSSTVISEPNIAYTNASSEKTGSLRLQVMQFEKGDIGNSGLAAKANWNKTAALTEEIEKKGSCNGENIAFRIEDTTYQDAWYDYLEDALGADKYDEVEVDSVNDDTVEVKIKGIRQTDESVSFVVNKDKGITRPGWKEYDRRFAPFPDKGGKNNKPFSIRVDVKNVGESEDTQEITASIWDENLEKELLETEYDSGGGLTLSENENKTIDHPELKFEHSKYKDKLSHGNVYKYIVKTEDDELDEPGSFYVGKKGTHLNLTNDDIETSEEDDNMTISADVRNVGIENATSADITLEFDDLNITDTRTLDVDYGATGTVEWTVNKTALPVGEHDVTIDTGDETASTTVVGESTGDGGTFVVVEDEGAGNDQIVEDDGTPFEVRAGVISTYSNNNVKRDVTLTIPDAGVEIGNRTILDSGESETVVFDVDPDNHSFEHGKVYEYDVQAEESSLNETGSFYFGHPGTEFELSNGNATVGDEEVTITADLHNTGVDDGEQNVSLDLDLRDPPEDLNEDNYTGIDAGTINRSFGENDTVELPINKSVLVDSTYDATISTEDDELEVTFNVTAGVDPGRVGLSDVENATVDISVLSSQVSGIHRGDHKLGTMTLEVLTEQDGETNTEHVFENPENGRNINTYPTWQDKSDRVYNTTIEIEEEATLTLASKSYGLPGQTAGCEWKEEDRFIDTFFGPYPVGDHQWCEDFDTSSTDYLVDPVDATADKQEQNLRVRTAKNNDLPSLQPGNEEQESVNEILSDISDPAIDRDSLWEDGELDLNEDEFIFLFEMTTECGMRDSSCDADNNDIDALWESAQHQSVSGDPNFNDLIVYVEVERAGVNPGKPSITIVPGDGNEADIDPGEGDEAGTPADPELNIDGEVDESDSPDIGAGDSDSDTTGTGTMTNDTNINIGSDNVILG